MAQTRSLLSTVTGKPAKEMRKYQVAVPTMRAAASQRIAELEARSRVPEPRASRCCGRCKTPFNCGNKACACHAMDAR